MITEQSKAKSLYIAYFGVSEPLVQTQVIPYLRELVKNGNDITLLTFEPGAIKEKDFRAELSAQGIGWHWLRYHKRPSVPATLFDIANGAYYIRKLLRREQFDILHARSHVPMMMAAIARKISLGEPSLIFDIRGFMPEEYVDAGIWPENGIVYRSVKRVESWLLKKADGFVVLTEKAREILFPESVVSGHDSLTRPVEVIPCCVDLRRFETANDSSRQACRDKLGIGERFVVVYVGALGGWYLTEEMADFFGAVKLRCSNAFALILTQSDSEKIRPLLMDRGFFETDFLIQKVLPEEIPKYLSAADAAISLIKPCYSKQASSPTKNAEYLACGLPIVANAGVGDVDRTTIADRTGIILEGFSSDAYSSSLDQLDKLLADGGDLADRCRQSAQTRFDLETVGGKRYRRLYEKIKDKNR